mgnify:CR=1 FL=1
MGLTQFCLAMTIIKYLYRKLIDSVYSDQLISHPELQPLMKRFKKKFPKIDLEPNMMCLGWLGYQGMGLDVDAVKMIFEISLKENKYFKVWNLKWKGPDPMPHDWYQGKGAFYKYKG